MSDAPKLGEESMSEKGDENGEPPALDDRVTISRRFFAEAVAIAGAGLAALDVSTRARAGPSQPRSLSDETKHKPTEDDMIIGGGGGR